MYCTVESVLHRSVPVSNHSLNKSFKMIGKYCSRISFSGFTDNAQGRFTHCSHKFFPRTILHNCSVKPSNKVDVFFSALSIQFISTDNSAKM